MDNPLARLNWSLVQSFLAVAEHGSLSGAAAALGQSQPTLGRHISQLEAELEVELFQRHARGLRLSPEGARLEPAARDMLAAMTRLTSLADAAAGLPGGTVRIASSVFVAHHVLPPILAALRETAPQVTLVLMASDDTENLLYRDADIALRMYRPTQLELITRHVCDLPMGVFAARRYLERRGRPDSLDALLDHDLVGYDRSPLIRTVVKGLGIDPDTLNFTLATDNQTAYWELVRQGGGIGFTQSHVGRAAPEVEELDVGLALPPLPVWLTTHADIRTVPRVAVVWDALTRALTDRFGPPGPD